MGKKPIAQVTGIFEPDFSKIKTWIINIALTLDRMMLSKTAPGNGVQKSILALIKDQEQLPRWWP